MRLLVLYAVVTVACSCGDRAAPNVSGAGSPAGARSAVTAVPWPPVTAPRTAARAWPAAGGAWVVATVCGGAGGLEGRGAVTSPIPSRHEIEVDGIHYAFSSDINGTIFHARFLLPGAAERPDDVRAWLGLPPAGDRATGDGDIDPLVIHGDQVEIERVVPGAKGARLRGIHAALRALDDELIARHADPHGMFWYDFDDSHPERLTLEYINWDFCEEHGDEIIAGFRNESPTSPRRLALEQLGFEQVTCQWTKTYQSYVFP